MNDILTKLDDIEIILTSLDEETPEYRGLGERLYQRSLDHDEVMAHLQAQLMTAKRVVRELERELSLIPKRKTA